MGRTASAVVSRPRGHPPQLEGGLVSAMPFRWVRWSCLAMLGGLWGCTPVARDTSPSAPGRIVSLGPAATEAVVALGAMDRLIGRSRWDRWPDTVRSIPELGDAIRPSVERLVAAQPDLVILYPAADNSAAAAALANAGIRVLALRIDSVSDYLAALDSLGRVLEVSARADSLGTALRGALGAVQGAAAGRARWRVFFPVWDQPLMTVGRGSYLSELAALAGGDNIYADRAEPSFPVALEDVIGRDPDIVLTTPAGRSRLLGDPRWRGLRAVREGRVLAFDTMLVSQPSTRMGEAAASLARLLDGATR